MPDPTASPTRPALGAQFPRPTKRLLTPDEAREFDASPVVESFVPSMLPAAERAHAVAAGNAAKALVLKGLLHRLDPATYAGPTRDDAPEAAAVAVARGIDERTFARMAPRLRALAADPARVRRVLGTAGALDLRRPSLGLTLARPLDGAALRRVAIADAEPDDASPERTARTAARYRRMDLILRAVHCVDETDPEGGDDDIVLGGVLVGASGNTNVVEARFIGNFNDGTYVSLGELPFGQFSLRTTPGYPKTMYCVLQLVESDRDDADAARALTSALQSIATIVVGAVATPAAGVVAGAIVNAIGGMIGVFIDDDHFPPYGIRATLQSENQFGADGDSGRQRTGNIAGHGGSYRIGFRWLLNA